MTGAGLQEWAAPLGAAAARRQFKSEDWTAKDRHDRVQIVADVIVEVLKEQIGDRKYSSGNRLPNFAMSLVWLGELVEHRFAVVGMFDFETFYADGFGEFYSAISLLIDEGVVVRRKRPGSPRYIKLTKPYVRDLLYAPHEWPAVVYDEYQRMAVARGMYPGGYLRQSA